jgi:hypothetical protein
MAGLSILKQRRSDRASRAGVLEAYFIVAGPAGMPLDVPVDEQKFLAQCIVMAGNTSCEAATNPECHQPRTLTNALALAANRGLLQSGADGLADKRRRFARRRPLRLPAGGDRELVTGACAGSALMPATDAIAAIEAGRISAPSSTSTAH